MARYALITADGIVDGIILLDEGSAYTPAAGLKLIAADNAAEPGGSYDGKQFLPPADAAAAGNFPASDPIVRLKAFLEQNPDVAALIA